MKTWAVQLGEEIIKEYNIPFKGIIVESEEKPSGSQINQYLKEQHFPEKEDVFYDLITDITEINL
ncbi:hypothetical protein [Halalkalibacter alkaliphilus]|uniref:Uncharacterized protein n=1 Tax=Halalkalibacter alkaliphilus TaxID=2917993 RepID=A0A9X2CRR6_9BACI|nr:hypothetical protein [Halalkalibacter alkaliphilus]MCL7746805.1 hypothetical protein [Halalkalibacter alkaliphilus]